MNLRRIQVFLLVVDKGSFSEAATAAELTQPAVSQQIKVLEDEMGVPLLERTAYGLTPTPAGKYIYQTGKDMLNKWQEMKEQVQTFQKTLTGSLRIGASTIPGTYLMPRWIGAFNQLFPNVDITVDVNASDDILAKLEKQKVDLAITGRRPSSQKITSSLSIKDSLVLISPKDHPLGKSIFPDDPCELAPYPFVIREKGSGTRSAMEEGLTACGMDITDLKIIAQFSTTEALIAAVEYGLGISYISKLAARPAVESGRVQLVSEIEPFRQSYHLSYLSTREANPIIKAFLSSVMKIEEDMEKPT